MGFQFQLVFITSCPSFSPSVLTSTLTSSPCLSLLFSRLNSPCSLSFFSDQTCSIPFLIINSLLDSFQCVHVSHVLGSPPLAPALQVCLSGAEQRSRITSLLPVLAALCLMQPARLGDPFALVLFLWEP